MKKEISRRDFLKYAGVIAVKFTFWGFGLNPSEIVSQPEQETQLAQIVSKGSPDKPWVALTIDDCWDLRGVERILKVYEKYEDSPRLTFFPVGMMVEKDPELWKEVTARGHEIGNHTYKHEYLDKGKLGEEGIFETIKKANEVIFQATSVFPRFFRPPGMYGFTKINDYCNWLRRIIFKCNLPFVALWSRDSYSGAIKLGKEAEETDDEIVKRVVSVGSSAKNGDIVLMHVNKWDLSAVEEIIAKLLKKEMKLVTLSELFGIVPLENKQNELSTGGGYEEYYKL